MLPPLLISASALILAYYLAALGHAVIEKSGVLNLAIDGVFVLGVAIAYAQAIYTGNNMLVAFLTTILVALSIGLFMTYVVTKFPVSHGAVGLSLMFLSYGLAGLIGVPARTLQGLTGIKVGYPFSPRGFEAISAFIIIALLSIFSNLLMERTKLGAMIRACGEDPLSAEALGVNVVKTRLIAALIGFSLIGLGSGVFELFYSRVWSEGHGLGQGWIAFSIALSSGRHPMLMIPSSIIFGLLFEYRYTLVGFGLPREFAEALPFITAIAAMAIYMATPLKRRLAPPKSLGKPFFKEERTV